MCDNNSAKQIFESNSVTAALGTSPTICVLLVPSSTDDDIFITLESRRKEWDNDLKELHSRITTNNRELRESQGSSSGT